MKKIFLLFFFAFFSNAMEIDTHHTHGILKSLENTQIIEEIAANLYLPNALDLRLVSKTTNEGVTNYLQKNVYQIFIRQMQAPFFFDFTECPNEIINTAFKKAREESWIHDANTLYSDSKKRWEFFMNQPFYTQNNERHSINKVTFYKYSIQYFCQKLAQFNTQEEPHLFYLLLTNSNNLDLSLIKQTITQNHEVISNTFVIEQEIGPIPLLIYLLLNLQKRDVNLSYISNHIDLQYKDSKKRSLIHYAIMYNNQELFENLIESNVSPIGKDYKNRNALHYAIVYNQDIIFEKLLALGVPLDDQDREGNTPFMLAITMFKTKILNLILDKYEPNLFLKNHKNKNAIDLLNEHEELRRYNQDIKRNDVAKKLREKFYIIKNKIMTLAEKQKIN